VALASQDFQVILVTLAFQALVDVRALADSVASVEILVTQVFLVIVVILVSRVILEEVDFRVRAFQVILENLAFLDTVE